jgi:large subunit ribosomal protein L24
MKLKKGDEVQVVAGRDKGKKGKIEKVVAKMNKVFVENINVYKRHLKGRIAGQKSEIVPISKPVPVASIMLVCPKCHLPTRVGFRVHNNDKIRICKKCEQEI